MFREAPDQPLWLAMQRQGELIHEAAQDRLARAHPDESVAHLATGPFIGIRASLGGRFTGVRRALWGYEAPCNDPCPDCAPC